VASKELRCVKCGCHIAGVYKVISPGRGICGKCLRGETK